MVASHAKLPPAPPKSDAEKAAEADKAAAAKAKDAADLTQGAGQGGRQLQEERRLDGPQEVANSGGEEREKGTSGCPSFSPGE